MTNTDGGTSINRRTFLGRGAAVAGVAVTGTMLGACGSGSGGGAERSRKVTIAAPQDPALTAVKGSLLPQFTRETGIKVEYLETDWGSLLQKVMRDAQNNTGVYDLVIGNDVWIPQLAEPHLIRELGGLGVNPDADVFPALVEDGRFPRANAPVPPAARGRKPAFYSQAIVSDVSSFVYRKDVFDGPPKTWDEVLATVDKAANPDKKLYSYVFPGSRSNGDPWWWTPILYTYGGAIFDTNWQPAFNGPGGVQALDMMFSLSRKAPPGVAQFGFDQLSQTLNSGQALCSIAYMGWVKDVFDPKLSKVANKMASCAPPAGTVRSATIGPFMTMVPKSARNPDGAARLVNWLISQPVQRRLAADFGVAPIRRSVLEDPELQAKHPYFKGISESLSVAKLFPPTDQFAAIYDPLSIQLNKAYSEHGRAGSKTYLDAAANGMREALRRTGYYA